MSASPLGLGGSGRGRTRRDRWPTIEASVCVITAPGFTAFHNLEDKESVTRASPQAVLQVRDGHGPANKAGSLGPCVSTSRMVTPRPRHRARVARSTRPGDGATTLSVAFRGGVVRLTESPTMMTSAARTVVVIELLSVAGSSARSGDHDDRGRPRAASPRSRRTHGRRPGAGRHGRTERHPAGGFRQLRAEIQSHGLHVAMHTLPPVWNPVPTPVCCCPCVTARG